MTGIHEPERMPFFFPWTDVPDDELPMQFVQYHWKSSAEWTRTSWELNLGVVRRPADRRTRREHA